MKKSELRKCVSEYLKLSHEIKVREAEQEAITARIKRHMGSNELETIDNVVIRYTTVPQNRLDTKLLESEDSVAYL